MPIDPIAPVVTSQEIGHSFVELASTRVLDLPNSLAFTNLRSINPAFGAHMESHVYTRRKATLDCIQLVALPIGVVLYGGGHFLIGYKNALLVEQYPPYIGSLVPSVGDIVRPIRETIYVPDELLLVARFGLSTWGHWIGELLGKVLLTERNFPNRFRYVLPSHVLNVLTPASVWTNIRESLVSCGINLDRIFPIEDDKNYAFSNLSVVTPLWSDHTIHPDASAILRSSVAHIEPAPLKRLAVRRSPVFGRVLSNYMEIYSLLEARSFSVQETGALCFRDQVAIFKGATEIFGVLGSDLTNIIFAPNGVAVLAAAPSVFGDRFFYALTLDRCGCFSDLRGNVTEAHEVSHKGSFQLSVDDLKHALDLLGIEPHS